MNTFSRAANQFELSIDDIIGAAQSSVASHTRLQPFYCAEASRQSTLRLSHEF